MAKITLIHLQIEEEDAERVALALARYYGRQADDDTPLPQYIRRKIRSDIRRAANRGARLLAEETLTYTPIDIEESE